ncbi:MAG TPA: long-chain fatty acid--CoA ligase [Roseiarcus sp.]|nr:long-chain fatty acid--CoA ligase [Roseiarcus sp.]
MTPDIGLSHWFAERALRTPERKALYFEGRDWTYGQFQQEIEDVAARLAALGVAKGQRVAFLGHNQPMFLFAMFAVARLGAIFTPLNFRLTGPELAFMLEDSGSQALIVDDAHRAVIAPELERLGALKAVLAAERPRQWSEATPPPVAQVATREDDVALIMYTSGTTGRPKGAMLTHGNFWWNNTSGMHAMDVCADDVTLVAAPIFHIGGLNVTTLTALQKGALVVLHRTFDPARALADIAAHRVTTMFGVPAMFLFMAQQPGFAECDLSTLRLLVVGGAPCPLPLLNVYLARGISIQQGYGLTETAPMVSFLSPEHALRKLGSSGRTPIFVEVKIASLDGKPVEAPGAPGEILVRGPNVFKGYWGQPEATAKAIDAEGWFHTGDAGFVDDEGFLTISDRIKDMIITGGENVYPAEIESELMRHPAVAEVGVIGEPSARWGEQVVAVIALKPGATLTLEELRAFAAQRLAVYKLPKRLELVAALPRNATGKILKQRLRETLAKPAAG